MKRFHVHARVDDRSRSIDLDSKRFGVAPSRVEADDAGRMLEDPRVDFAIPVESGACC